MALGFVVGFGFSRWFLAERRFRVFVVGGGFSRWFLVERRFRVFVVGVGVGRAVLCGLWVEASSLSVLASAVGCRPSGAFGLLAFERGQLRLFGGPGLNVLR